MAIFTGGPSGDAKDIIGSEYLQGAVDGTAWGRREPLIDPDKLKVRFLFGIPMYSAIPDPVTQVRAPYTNEMMKDAILRAANRIELETSITILPVERKVKMPFDRTEYLNLGYVLMPHRPILKMVSMYVADAQQQPIYAIPNEWIDMGQAHKGQINVLPLQPAYLNSGYLPSQTSGGAAWLSILGARGWIGSYWMVDYVTGFDESGIPSTMNDLIGIEAAIDILNMLQATNRVSSHSLGIDAMSQSVSTPGPQVYQARLEGLEKQKQVLKGKLKSLYQLGIHSSNV
jgi:hypothetical protein